MDGRKLKKLIRVLHTDDSSLTSIKLIRSTYMENLSFCSVNGKISTTLFSITKQLAHNHENPMSPPNISSSQKTPNTTNTLQRGTNNRRNLSKYPVSRMQAA